MSPRYIYIFCTLLCRYFQHPAHKQCLGKKSEKYKHQKLIYAQTVASKYHFSVKGVRFPCTMADTYNGSVNTQNNPGISCQFNSMDTTKDFEDHVIRT